MSSGTLPRPSVGVIIASLLILAACTHNIMPPAHAQGGDPCKSPATFIPEPSPMSKRKIALLVGINQYQGTGSEKPPTLQGAINDVCRIKEVLTSSRYGFAPQDVHILVGSAATRAAILKEFETHLISNMREGKDDIAIFAFSGHGSYVADKDDPTGIDQTIVAFDSRDPRLMSDIRDKDLNNLLQRLTAKTKNITVILDSCHSGTGLKDLELAPVRLAPPIGKVPLGSPLSRPSGTDARNAKPSGSGFPVSNASYVLLAAAQSDQQAREYPGEQGRMYGAFTYFLTQEMMRPSAVQRSYRDIMSVVARRVNQVFPSQTPQLESGASARLDQVVLGDNTLPTQAYIEVTPIDQGRVQLVGGRLHAFTEGSIYEVYDQDAHQFQPPEKPIAKVELVKVDDFMSEAKILDGKISDAARGVEREHRYGVARSKVYFEGLAKSRVLKSIKTFFDDSERSPIETVSEKRFADIICVETQAWVHTVGQDERDLSPPLSVNDPDIDTKLHTRLTEWAKWFNLRRVENASTASRVKIEIVRNDGSSVKHPGEVVRFKPNEAYSVRVKNLSSRKLYVYILAFTRAGRIFQVYPGEGETVSLDASKDMLIPDWSANLPKGGQKYARDVHKLFATSAPVNFWYLEQDAIRDLEAKSPPTDPLGQMLLDAALGSKDPDRKVPKEWATDEAVSETCEEKDCVQR